MTSISTLALLASFSGGLISFLSPCVLPLVPGYVSYVAGESLRNRQTGAGTETRLNPLLLSILFVLGFSTVFVIFGASATALGRLFLSYRYEANLAAGATVIVFGLLMMGLVRWRWLLRDFRLHPQIPGGRPVAAFVLGLAFAFGWTPCIGPVLGTILTTSAIDATVSQGIILLSVYSMGLGAPFLLAAMFTDRLFARLRHFGRSGWLLQIAAGTIVVAMGIGIMTGEMTAMSYWLLETFPFFANVG